MKFIVKIIETKTGKLEREIECNSEREPRRRDET